MPLSDLDLNRILKLDYELECFAVKIGGEWRLKNDSGRCVFLIEERCGIYPHRPEGCRLYPLVYDEAQRKAVIDPLCRYGYLFKVQKNDIERLKTLARTLRQTR